jgi:hypothetical protein
MSKGGARNRSGPQADPNSGRSDRRSYTLTALPSEGYRDDAPEFPLLDASRRELDLWAWAWTTPQACAWSLEPWRWHTVAMWVRTAVVCEGSEATAADKGSIHRFADQVGLTPAGLRENGWAIARDEVSQKRVAPEQPRPARRLRAADAQ